ncbi:MAG: transcriptional regulator [Rhizobiales bacterium PAR1]|nr:MAG: transcriptional regulator [Rhizobiales bacterium PAR1]
MTILASAAHVLRCFDSECTEVTVSDLVTRLGMPKSNASRLLRAMRAVGLLETVGASKRYRPGRLLVDLARVYRRSSTLLEHASAVVAKVSSACGHTGYVSIQDGMMVMAVTDHPGSNALRVVSTIGRRLPAFASATGRSLLARLPDGEVKRLYATGLKPPSPSAPQSVEELLERLGRIRESGIATSSDEATRGADALAVAVGDPATGEEVSLCIVLPASAVDAAERAAIGQALYEGAAEIAALTGDAYFPRMSAAA